MLKFKDPAQETDDTSSNYSTSFKGQEAHHTDIRRIGFTVEFLIVATPGGQWSTLCRNCFIPQERAFT